MRCETRTVNLFQCHSFEGPDDVQGVAIGFANSSSPNAAAEPARFAPGTSHRRDQLTPERLHD
jgi:hypothetical protein